MATAGCVVSHSRKKRTTYCTKKKNTPADDMWFQLLTLLFLFETRITAFVLHSASGKLSTRSARKSLTDTQIIECSDCSEDEIKTAATFLVEQFWLGSPRQWVDATDDDTAGSAIADISKLVDEQANDLTAKYGERMGKRTLNTCLLIAGQESNIVGLLGMEVVLLQNDDYRLLTPEASEAIVQAAVASLGPKQRREYKNASIIQIVNDLLDETMSAVCCFSNLAVNQQSRGQGIARQLCERVEETAQDWGFSEVYLKVEADNTAATNLYDKLQYETVTTILNDAAMRLNTSNVEFVQANVDTLLLKKDIVGQLR